MADENGKNPESASLKRIRLDQEETAIDGGVINPQPPQKKTKEIKNLYDEDDKGPYLVYIDLIDEPIQGEKRKALNQIRLGSILNSLGANNISAIKKIGFRRCKVIFTNHRSANWIVQNENLEKHKLGARILPSFLMKFGLVFGVPIEYTEAQLYDMIEQNPDHPVKSIERIFRKDRTTNELVATMRVKIGFKSTFVPDEIKFGYAVMECKYYIPNIRQCFKCQRFGHQAEHCKSAQICINCGGPHSKNECNNSFKCCANCGGSHAANDRNCLMRDRYTKIHKIMVLENLNFKEAEKKFTVPEFNYVPADFPTLTSKKVLPTVQEQVNNIIYSNYPVSSIFHSKKKTPKKTNSKPYEPPPTITDIYKDMENRGPVFDQEVYVASKVSEYERVLTEILNKTNQILKGEDENLTATLLKEIADMAKTTQEVNPDESMSGNNSSISSTC